MLEEFRRPSPALVVSLIALFVALGGTVYAAAGKIDGKTVKTKSLPGNRLKPGSVPGNRLKANVLQGYVRAPITGKEIDEKTIGTVASADYAETAGKAQNADFAQTSLNAVNAVDASTVNGHSAGCQAGTRFFAGACWQSSSSENSVTAPEAALACASLGAELPEALQLAAFALQEGVVLDAGDEWSSDITNVSGPNTYDVVTTSDSGDINAPISTSHHHYRCVIPLVT
jgi:hypothetical protein